jgi:pimeloyl-ACP methyl ester carboxylesterase
MDATRPPARALTWLEPVRAAGEFASLVPALPFLARAPRGDGHPVLVLPGFMASDASTAVLRGFLDGRGLRTHPWELGRNRGFSTMRDALVQRFLTLSDAAGEPLSLVGWSLGGVMGRYLARHHPERIRQLVTLGSPLHGHPGDTAVGRLYERVDPAVRARFAALRRAGALLSPPVDVPTSAVYSRSDGIVPWSMAREIPGARAENIRVLASHLGLGVHPAVLYAVADRLAQPADQWRPFKPPVWSRILYPRID